MEVKWQRGKFIRFFAKMKIRIGGRDNTVDTIYKDDEFEYDGSILKYAGAEISSTQLRGAIEAGWASFTQGNDEKVGTFSPGRNIAKATTINRDLSRVQRGGNSMNTDSLDEETVLEVNDRGKTEKAHVGQSPKVMTRVNNRRGVFVSDSEIDSQDGVVVGRLNPNAASRKTVTDVTVDPGLVDTILNRCRVAPELSKVVVTEGVEIKVNSNVNRNVVLGGEEEGTVVGKVPRTVEKKYEGGIEVKDTSNIRNRKAVSDSVADTKLPTKIRVARRVDPTFPADWSFTGRVADRLAAAKKHGITPQFLEALYAAEGDQFRKLLEKTYPKQFGSQ
jgi:hypothetical protein